MTKCKQTSLHFIKHILHEYELKCCSLTHTWNGLGNPQSFPIPISLIFSKDPALLLEVGPLVTHSTFSESGYVYDHIFNYSREHMLMLIHFEIGKRCESQEPYGSHLQRGKRCVKFLTSLAPNKIKFTSKAGHSFGASKMRAGTCSQRSTCISSSCTAL